MQPPPYPSPFGPGFALAQYMNPYISTTGIPQWAGVGPMIYTQRTMGASYPHPAPVSGAQARAMRYAETEANMHNSITQYKGMYEGWATRTEKFLLDSRVAQGTNSSPADFTVPLPHFMTYQWCRYIHLGDIQFDGGEMFIERDWSRWNFDESFACDWQNRAFKIQFMDGTVYEVWMPYTTTPVLQITQTGLNTVEIDFGDVICSSPETLIPTWQEFGGTILICGTPYTTTGEIILNQNTVISIKSVGGDLTKWSVVFYDQSAMNFVPTFPVPDPYSPVPYFGGNLLISPIPSPQALATVATTMIQGALPYVVVGGETKAAVSHSRQWNLSLTYNNQTDIATISYSMSPQVAAALGYPKITGSILSFFGFSPQVDLMASFQAQEYVKEQLISTTVFNSTHVNVTSSQPLPRPINTGTRLPEGNPPKGCLSTYYSASCALVNWIEDSMNGTWFGRSDEPVDSAAANPFVVQFVNEQTNATVTVTIDAGRYTPAEVAEQFNTKQTLVTATAFYTEDHVYKGLRFEARLPSYYFGIRFDTSTIDPKRFGYDAFFYTGQEMYEPVKAAEPYYANLYYGQSLLRRPTYYHYHAVLDSTTNAMRITPVAFRPRAGTVRTVNPTTRQVRIEMPIAHGATANARVVLTNGTYSLVGFVLAPPALDVGKKGGPFVGYQDSEGNFSLKEGYYGSREPLFLTAVVGGGGTIPFDVDDVVTVIFTAPRSWGVDLLPAVDYSIQPSTVGCLAMYMSMTRPAFITLVTPERINPFPVQWVILYILVDGHEQGQQTSMVVRESLETPTRSEFRYVTSLARLLVGNKRSDLTYDSFDRMNVITFMDQFVKLKRIGVRVVRPDGSLYNFHGNPFSVNLVFTMAEQMKNK